MRNLFDSVEKKDVFFLCGSNDIRTVENKSKHFGDKPIQIFDCKLLK